MQKEQMVFVGGAAVILLLIWSWMAIGSWPTSAVEWRAERGDQLAVEEMFRRNKDSIDGGKWLELQRSISPGEAIFLPHDQQKIMRLLFKVQGKDTSLLDIFER